MKILKPHPSVWIFNKAIEEPQKIIDFYEENFEWEDWYTFGKMLDIPLQVTYFNKFPDMDEWKKEAYQKKLYTEEHFQNIEKILDVFYKTTEMYLNNNNIEIKNPVFLPFNIAKYIASPIARMNYHTDYQQERYKIPEPKAHTTTLFYLNDNYKGGEISFIELNDNKEIIWNYDYKPKAGDVVIFSSMHPLYHGVKTITEGEKYLIRTYWHSNETVNEDWEKGVSEYGEQKWRDLKEKEAKEVRVEMIGREYNNEYITIQYTERDNER